MCVCGRLDIVASVLADVISSKRNFRYVTKFFLDEI